MTDDAPKVEPMNFTSYSVNQATKRSDGTIAVPAGGYADGSGVWDGFIEVRPDDADYKFWLWLLKRWRYHSQLSSKDIPTLKEEYAKDAA